MLRHCLHGLSAFPNMATDVNIAMKHRQKNGPMGTLVDNDKVVSTWSVHNSKYGK